MMLENLPLHRYFNPSSVLWEVSMDIFWNCTITWGSYIHVCLIYHHVCIWTNMPQMSSQGNNHYAKMCFSKKPKDLNPQKLI